MHSLEGRLSRFPKILLSVLVVVLVCAGALSLCAAPAKDTLTVTALPSTTPAPTVTPVLVNEGGGSSNYFYPYATTDCSSGRIFPVEFVWTDTNSNYSGGATVHFFAAGGPGLTVSVPADFSINESSGTVPKTIVVTPPCTPGDYQTNIQIQVSPAGEVKVEHATIHIRIRVGDPGPRCFLTDSSYNFLTDCSGAPVEADGTFLIVAKANGRIVATNPGQFYYNLIWTNTGGTQPITVNLGPVTNLVPHGANAVHALVFDAGGFTDDRDSWEMVNQDGTPCGPSGPCTVTVGAGQVLWVTWHLEFSLVGSPSAGIGSTCGGAGGVPISASATLSSNGPLSSGGTALASCSAGATGYLKR